VTLSGEIYIKVSLHFDGHFDMLMPKYVCMFAINCLNGHTLWFVTVAFPARLGVAKKTAGLGIRPDPNGSVFKDATRVVVEGLGSDLFKNI
jgi:hypothetical protein